MFGLFLVGWLALLVNGVQTEYNLTGVVDPVECVGVACDAEHDKSEFSFDEPGGDDDSDDDDQDDDKGHGNDDDHDDDDNPGKGN